MLPLFKKSEDLTFYTVSQLLWASKISVSFFCLLLLFPSALWLLHCFWQGWKLRLSFFFSFFFLFAEERPCALNSCTCQETPAVRNRLLWCLSLLKCHASHAVRVLLNDSSLRIEIGGEVRKDADKMREDDGFTAVVIAVSYLFGFLIGNLQFIVCKIVEHLLFSN